MYSIGMNMEDYFYKRWTWWSKNIIVSLIQTSEQMLSCWTVGFQQLYLEFILKNRVYNVYFGPLDVDLLTA